MNSENLPQASTMQSPLMEVPKDSLSELFARDPLSLTKADITTIVAELRAQRAKWVQADAIKQTKPKAEKKAKPSLDPSLQADIEDLLANLDL